MLCNHYKQSDVSLPYLRHLKSLTKLLNKSGTLTLVKSGITGFISIGAAICRENNCIT